MNTHQPANNGADWLQAGDNTFDVKAFLYRYIIRYWYLFILLPMLAAGAGMLYLRYQVPVYQVRSTLLIKNNNSYSEVNESAVLEDLGIERNTRNLENEIQILKSRSLMKKVVDSLQLNVNYFWEGRVRNTELYKNSPIVVDSFRLNPAGYGKTFGIKAVDEQTLSFQFGEEEQLHPFDTVFTNKFGSFRFNYRVRGSSIGKPMLFRFNSVTAVAQYYSNKLNIRPVGSSDVLSLSMSDVVPKRGVDILNTLVSVYNTATIEDKNKVGRNTLKFIDERLEFITKDLASVETDVQDYKTDNEITTEIASDVTLVQQRISEYEKELTDLEVKLNLLNVLRSYLQDAESQFQLLPANLETANTSLTNSIKSLNDLILNRERLMKSGSDLNPAIQTIDAEILTIRSAIINDLAVMERNIKSSIDELKGKISALTGKIRTIPRKERELNEIRRQQYIKENLYVYLLEKREETALSLAVAVSNSRVIDSASPGGPIQANPFSIIAIAAFGGLILAITIIALRELLNDTIQTEEDIKNITSIPILGGINFKPSEEEIVVGKEDRSAIAEMFRLLRTNLQYTGDNNRQQTILVTSGMSGEGKTFITANLGVSLAISKKKTLLIGLDLRKPKLTNYLIDEDQPVGITNYLIGEASEEEIIFQSELSEDLYFIPSGPIPPNPAELLMNDRLDELFEKLQQEYDYILLDSPPVGMVADALLLNKYLTSTLFVVRFGHTKRGLLKILDEIYRNTKLTRPSIVFNGIKSDGRYGYGYGYGGTGYGYYEVKKRKKKFLGV